MTIYMICDGDGNALSDGLQGYDYAAQVAQRSANERGESVWLSESGSDGMGEEFEPEASRFELVFAGSLPLYVEAAFADEFDRGIRREHKTYKDAEREAHAVLAQCPNRNWRAAHPAIIYGPDCGADGRTIA